MCVSFLDQICILAFGSCGFGHITEEILNGKLHCLCSVYFRPGVFSISVFLVKFLINKNCHNWKTCHDIGIKLGPLSKLEKRNTMASKKFERDVISAIYGFIVFFRYMDYLEQPRGWVPEA